MCKYFSHDCDAHRSKKMRTLRGELGNRAYGAYWVIIEMLREEADHKLPLNFKALKIAVGESPKFIERIVRDYKLFVVDEERGEFYSQGLMERMDLVYNKVSRTAYTAPTLTEDEDEDTAKPKYTLSDEAREARRKGGQKTKSEYKTTKSETKSEEEKTKSVTKKTKSVTKKTKSETKKTKSETKSEEEKTKSVTKKTKSETKSEEEKTKSETKSDQNGEIIEGLEKEKEKNIKAKAHTPLAPLKGEGARSELYDDEGEWADEEFRRALAHNRIKPTTIEAICALYEKHCSGLLPLTSYEREAVSPIANALSDLGNERLEELFIRAGRSSFLCGGGSGGFRADFSWLLKRGNYEKVLSGKYDDRPSTPPKQTVGVPMEIDADQAKDYAARFHRLE